MNVIQVFIVFLIHKINISAECSLRIGLNNKTLSGYTFSNTSTIDNNDEPILKRDKRFILFDGGGVSKSVFGILVPIETRDKVNWRTMNLGYNFQAQYVPIPSVIYPWEVFQRSMVERKREFNEEGTYFKDETRKFVYSAIEIMMTRLGKNGKECLLRSICEATHTPIKRISVFDEIVHLILTPNEEEVHDEYIDAKNAGNFGVDCFKTYSKCPLGDGIFDYISFIQ